VPLTRPQIGFKLILCDAAQTDAATGNIHNAVALMIQVPWDRTNQKLPVRVELVTDDGQPVSMPGPTGPQPIVSQIELEVGRPAGIAPGSTLSAVFAVNVAPMSLSPGRYEWRASVDGHSQLAVASHQRRGTFSILGAGEPSSAASAEIVKRAAHRRGRLGGRRRHVLGQLV
jgi:hypothetical protein